MEKRWIVLLVLFLARTAMGFQFQSVASAAPFMIHELSLSYAQIGTLIGLYMLPGVVISLPGGLLGRRFGDKTLCSAGLALMVLGGILVGFSQSYGTAFAGRLLSGVGGILFNLVLTKMLTDWFAGHRIVFAMGVLMSSWPFGIAAGLLFQGQIAIHYGWPWVMYAASGLSAVDFILIFALYQSPVVSGDMADAARYGRSSRFALPPMREALPAMVAGALWGSFNLGLVLFFSFVPPLLIEHGVRREEAAAQTSIALWICMLSVPLGGYAVQRFGRPNASIVLFSCLIGISLRLLLTGAPPAVLCAIIGVAIGPPPGAIMAMPARVLAPANRTTGFGVFYTCNYIVTAFGPALAGWLRDYWGSPMAPVLLGATSFIAVVPLLALFEFVASPRGALIAK